MKTLCNFIFGFVMSFVLITCTIKLENPIELVKFIGPSLLGAVIYVSENNIRDRLDRIETILDKFLRD